MSLPETDLAFESLQIIVPVHNERESIGAVLTELAGHLSARLPAQVVVCEDGSRDGTTALLKRLQPSLGFTLKTSPLRKGYSQAVKDGILGCYADYVLCLDSDGQLDPADLERLWERRDPDGIVIGYRSPRRDPWFRLVLSRAFYVFYCALITAKLRDPSCPLVLIPRRVIAQIIPRVRHMREGFWWEFTARCHLAGVPIHQVPIRHRRRERGRTTIYRPSALAGIFLRSLRALFVLRREPYRP